ncbi:NADH-quinone oxidoreductase subunit J [Kangiella sediminilitoris]|uniref:NADH-quinone oxidoreductase subunit J n=1 Tax=Kangiella sediminilitoris TaxID=1144748 RepID=A0A1B3BDD5_9GAMM|nr:NADH-quinone oxidoreductase subunit J [Kangiella sediminilitoris]AOE50811.1 NADH:ubiquinone oxidoreductase subunit J [Kangiella sediminilitoris]
MTVESIVFYLFATLTVIGAIGVITIRNAVQAVLCLVLTFFSAAVLWMLLEAEFLAVTLVLVYVGAVMVLFLFVVMMLDVDYASLKAGFTKYLPLGIITALAMFGGIYWVIRSEVFGLDKVPEPAKHGPEYSNVTELGSVLYTNYFFAFEVAGVILLVAIIAAISLTFRGRRDRRGQSVPTQQQTSKEERLRIVDIEIGPRQDGRDKIEKKKKSKRKTKGGKS